MQQEPKAKRAAETENTMLPIYSAPGNQMQQFFEIIAQKSHLEEWSHPGL